MSPPGPPTGTVTFLFTDVEGSTRLLRALGEGFTALQDIHSSVMRAAIAAEDGHEVRTEGDSFFVTFPTAGQALRAAVEAQRGLDEAAWPDGGPLRVRMGMHTGEGVLGGDDYVGLDVNLAARIAAAASGGQVLLSDATRALVQDALPDGVTIRALGEHTLKDFEEPQALFDLVVAGLGSEFPPIRTAGSPPASVLPSPRTSFIGRDRELAEVGDLLERARLVTLTGPGGTGKTRIALGVAAREAERFLDGAWFVDLSAVTDPEVVPSTIARTLGVRPDAMADPEHALTEHLRTKQLLLVLDNLEQVIDAATMVGRLLDASPDLSVLVTSRVPLHISGEHGYAVDPLPLPRRDGEGRLESLDTCESVVLFVERAAAVQRGFQLTEGNAAAIAAIVERLDGLPLAIELAASRAKMLDPEGLLERLGHRLPALSGGPRDVPERQQTLRDTIAWSHDLLDDPERRLFARLSVFSGGCTLEAAESICSEGLELDVVDGVGMLVDQSLLRREDGAFGVRFRMLETVREFGVERLEASDEADAIRRRHSWFVVAMVEEAEPKLLAHDRTLLDLLEVEHENVRAALRWSIETGEAEPGLRIVGAIWRFWQVRNHLAEGRRWAERVLSLPAAAERTSARAKGVLALGSLAYYLQDVDTVRVSYREGLDIAREIGDERAEAEAAYSLAFAHLIDQDLIGARELLQLAREIHERLGDPIRQALAKAGLGLIAEREGNLDDATSLLEQARATFIEADDRWGITWTSGQLASVAMEMGDLARARRGGLDSLDAAESLGAAGWNAVALRGLAVLAVREGDPERGVRLVGAAEHLQTITGGEAPPVITGMEDPLALIGDGLPAGRIQALLAEGRTMDVREALAYAREGAPAAPQEPAG